MPVYNFGFPTSIRGAAGWGRRYYRPALETQGGVPAASQYLELIGEPPKPFIGPRIPQGYQYKEGFSADELAERIQQLDELARAGRITWDEASRRAKELTRGGQRRWEPPQPFRPLKATGGIAGGGVPITHRFAWNEPQGYGLNRPAALSGPGAVTRRSSFGGNLPRALSQAWLEGGAPMQLVERKARPGMAAGGYGYQMPASARQMRPSPVQMAAMLESGQPMPPGFAQPPATPLPRRHGRIAAPPQPERRPLEEVIAESRLPLEQRIALREQRTTQPVTPSGAPQWQNQPWGAIPAEFQGIDPTELRRYWEMFAGPGRQPDPRISRELSWPGPRRPVTPPTPDAFWKWLWRRREGERVRGEAQTKTLGTPMPSWFEAGDIPYQTAETLPSIERSFIEWYRHRNPSLGRLGEKPPTPEDWQEFLQGRAEGIPIQSYRPPRPFRGGMLPPPGYKGPWM